MSKQTINIGASPNDGTGTPLRTSFDYTNQNFTELYTAVGPSGNNIVVPGNATITGDLTVDTSTLKVDSGANKVGIGTTTMNGVLTVKNPNVAVESSIYAIQAATSTSQLSSWTINQNTDVVSFGTDYAGALSLKTNSVERCNISPAGNVNISTGNVVMTTSGKGIDFSATANGSGTMTSELLNDYEEGTWTPVIKFGGTTATQNATKTSYTKIGRQVTCFVETYVTNLNGGTGTFEMSGLPFTSLAMRSAQGDFLFQFMSATFPAGDKMATINDSSTAFGINYFTGASGSALSLSDADFTTSSYVYAQLVYFV